MNIRRIWVIATNVFREVIRDRILYLVGIFALVLLMGNLLLPELAAGTESKMLLDLGLAAIGVAGLVVAVFVGTGLVNKEIEKRTVYVLNAKPLTPAEFVVGKHLGLSSVIAVMVAAMMAIYLGLLSLNGIDYSLASLSLAGLFLFLELVVIAAVAILFGVFTSTLLATVLTFAVYLMGHLSRDLVLLTRNVESATVDRLAQWAYLILPDLSRLDLKNQAVYGIGVLPPANELWINALYGALYIIVLLAIATLIYTQREF
jgi:ABC-type transport system involved in multi-copper enzyme maturation permease subunit